MDLFLSGQTAVVTGARRGIGPAVTRGLVAEGVRVPARASKSSAELDEPARAGLVRVVEVGRVRGTRNHRPLGRRILILPNDLTRGGFTGESLPLSTH
jgi:NAD(P)-dependent dehydrogenase (short-subunit alcohol dehydrogenase family)